MPASKEPANRPVTILDIARHVGMSKTTVSAALTGNGRLAGETRDIVTRAARELNYSAHPHAQSLRKKNSGEIVLVSENIDLGVLTRKMALIQKGLSARGFNAPIYAYSHGDGDEIGVNQDALLASMARVQPRAVVGNMMTLTPRSRDILLNLQNQGTAVVCYDSELDAPHLDQIIFDRADNTYQAARHLIELGHRDVGLVIFGNSPTAASRLEGFKNALAEAGFEPRTEWIFRGHMPGSAEIPEFIGVGAANYFANLPARPTGVCVLNDLSALAFIGEITRRGLSVPHDISVIGHDDIPIAQFAPLRLSSVSQPVEEIARAVVQRVIDRLENPELQPQQQWIRGQVTGRDSTAPLA